MFCSRGSTCLRPSFPVGGNFKQGLLLPSPGLHDAILQDGHKAGTRSCIFLTPAAHYASFGNNVEDKKIAVLSTLDFLAYKDCVHQSMPPVPVCPQHPQIGTHLTVSTGFTGAAPLAGPCVPMGPRGSAASAHAYYIHLHKLPLSVLLAESACHCWRSFLHSEERGPVGFRPRNSVCHSAFLEYVRPVCWETKG